MQIDLIAVGKRMPTWVDTAVKEYSKRLPKNINFNLVEITAATRNKNSTTDQIRQKEQEKIETAFLSDSIIIVLDERGETLNSQKLSAQLQSWIEEQQNISLVIGGADGLSGQIKKKANKIWSLSDMTLPHGLVRVIITEQLYRAWTILQNHPYHRE